jgi:hypothetical protein
MAQNEKAKMRNTETTETEIHPALARLKSVELEPSPFLSTRIQANLRATSQPAPPQWSWKSWKTTLSLSVAFSVALVLLVALVQGPKLLQSNVNSYALGKPYLIRVDVRELDPDEVAYAEIEIKGESAQFKSKAFEQLAEVKKITVNGEIFKNKQYLPIVVEGIKKGKSEVSVNFFDKNKKLLSSRVVDLSFAGGS